LSSNEPKRAVWVGEERWANQSEISLTGIAEPSLKPNNFGALALVAILIILASCLLMRRKW
jgi:hypothetical protein